MDGIRLLKALLAESHAGTRVPFSLQSFKSKLTGRDYWFRVVVLSSPGDKHLVMSGSRHLILEEPMLSLLAGGQVLREIKRQHGCQLDVSGVEDLLLKDFVEHVLEALQLLLLLVLPHEVVDLHELGRNVASLVAVGHRVLVLVQKVNVGVGFLVLRSEREQVVVLDLVQDFHVEALLVAQQDGAIHQELNLVFVLERCHEVGQVSELVNLLRN